MQKSSSVSYVLSFILQILAECCALVQNFKMDHWAVSTLVYTCIILPVKRKDTDMSTSDGVIFNFKPQCRVQVRSVEVSAAGCLDVS